MKKPTLLLAMFAIAGGGLALAGKPERDKQLQMQPQVKDVASAVRTMCGCPVVVDVKWSSYTRADDMSTINAALSAITTATKNQCTTPENKRALCENVKTIELSYSLNPGEPFLSGTAMRITSNNTTYSDERQLQGVFDKF
jgi:hypothetical protein